MADGHAPVGFLFACQRAGQRAAAVMLAPVNSAQHPGSPVAAGPRIVLVRTKESANVGSVARAMLNFGLRDLWLVAPRCQIDRRAYDLATHAEQVLENAKVVGDLSEAVADATTVYGTSARPRKADNYPVLTPREAGALLGQGAAVVFGPEDHGLSNDELTRCQAQVVIPTVDFSSLNLAQAVLVVAYEFAQAAGAAVDRERDPSDPRHAPVSREQLEGFYAQLKATMLKIGYTDERRAPGMLRLYRGLIDRAAPTAHEVASLRGLLSQAAWAADQPPSPRPSDED